MLGGPQSVPKASALLSRKCRYLCEALVTVMSTLPNFEETFSPPLPPHYLAPFCSHPQGTEISLLEISQTKSRSQS